MHRYLNEGNDINSASDMKRALDSYGGVKGCRTAVVSVDTSRQDITHHKWTGIQSLNNFQFETLGVRVWKAYGIGRGRLIRTQQLKKMAKPQVETGLVVLEEFCSPRTDIGALKKQVRQEKKRRRKTTLMLMATIQYSEDSPALK